MYEKEHMDSLLKLHADFDIRVETFVANLLQSGVDEFRELAIEDIYVVPKGPMRKRIERDLADVKRRFLMEEPVLWVEVNRRGFFDNLPERLLVDPEIHADRPVMRTKAIEGQISAARKLFLPFESAILAARVKVEAMEQHLVEEFPEFMNDLWGFSDFEDCLTKNQMFLLNYLIPEAHRMVGNWPLTERIFQSVLKYDVALRFEAPMSHPVPPEFAMNSTLNLGEPVILGSEFTDDMATLVIEIQGMSMEELPGFLEGGPTDRLLKEILCSYFLPLDTPYRIEVEPADEAFDVPLGEALLGLNFQLKDIPTEEFV